MKCPFYDKGCGGCRDIDQMYGDTLKKKEARIKKLFPQSEKIMGAEMPIHYRNKVLRTFANGKQSLYSGIYKAGTHQVISIKDCLLEDPDACRMAFGITELLAKEGINAYREDYHKGVLRHMQLRRGARSGETVVTLVTGTEELPNGEAIAKKIIEKYPAVRGVVQNYNPRDNSAVFGFKDKLLAGRDELWDTMCGLKVCLTGRTFYQVHTPQAEKLYDLAVKTAGLTGTENVLDAYCGVGVIGMRAAREARQVTGIEIVKPSVLCAQKSARVNRIENITFTCGDVMQSLKNSKEHFDCVFVDPPRAGCDVAFLKALAEHAPEKIVYISCFPESLARDVLLLSGYDYTPEFVKPVDLFPFTEHVETVALLTLNR